MLAVNPVTPIDIGVLDLVNPEILPNDNVPHGLVAEPVVAIPTTLLHSFTASSAKGIISVLEEQSTGILAERAEGS